MGDEGKNAVGKKKVRTWSYSFVGFTDSLSMLITPWHFRKVLGSLTLKRKMVLWLASKKF